MAGWRHAFSLSSEAVKDATPPGTVTLIGKTEHSVIHQNGRYVDRVVQFPLPTLSPADPLNWPSWRKMACMMTVAFYAFVANFLSASLAPALPVWNREFRQDVRPLSDLMQLVALNVLALGLGNVFWVPLSNVFGRRLVLVVSTLLLSVATTTGVFVKGFTPTLFVRVFQGLGSSASETVTPAVVGDLFFVHERGGWMAFYTASLASGSVLGGITGGYIANGLGWVAQFSVGAILTGLASVATFFLVPETMFDRPKHALPVQQQHWQQASLQTFQPNLAPRISVPPRISLADLPSARFTLPTRYTWATIIAVATRASTGMTWYDTESSQTELSSWPGPGRGGQPGPSRRSGPVSGEGSGEGSGAEYSPPPYTFAQSLKFSRYRGNVVHQFMKPWTTLLLPATWIVMMQYGGLVGGVAVISTVGPQILNHKPYFWGGNAGLLFVGALVGILLGGLCTGLLADRQLKRLARDQDHGFAEPEARIGLMLPSLLVGTCGLLVFGFCAQYPGRYQWVGLEFAYGMVAFALTQVPSIWFGYLIDSYEQLASDCFVMICILRALIPFAWTFIVAQWMEKSGYLVPFAGFTAIMGVFALLTIPIIVCGKRLRIATTRYVTKNQ
ncbi:MFS general substrate transporter [Parathielavia appendiculata]|uniref:MFS general substrate transporter n=1 Tax=Parathielavia appendiculata TaxID=2587402 RepID=A0AAN6TWR9_9PEZI|nr:MFS general substrate transporter [Parathielavia appendiculata]